ncbi:hypothetical protein [Xanthomonas sp. MUS 060]|uniref:hypothetical protein n=1 Tax=Xanthomonas sp. MUS 060 TaxID=1588031 RepID=UPI000AADA4CF|nr:hypothetical protein [Xanthomonas sp. MUS 060]
MRCGIVTSTLMLVVMAAAKRQDRLAEFIGRHVMGPRRLIIDEIAYLPLRHD